MTTHSSYKVLIVDDDEFITKIIGAQLEHAGFQTHAELGGAQALAYLKREGGAVNAILLDKSMPEMDGFEFLAQLKGIEQFKNIPVIMLTGTASKGDMERGLKAGAYYFLTKPAEQSVLVTIVNAAIADQVDVESLRTKIQDMERVFHLLDVGEFSFRTIKDARDLAMVLAHACPMPAAVVGGLAELLVNAVEHGNLALSYDEKTELMLASKLDVEIAARLAMPEYGERRAWVKLVREEGQLRFQIKDEGAGFDWQPYMDFDPDRLTHVHGRGIAMANNMAFSNLQYLGNGNELIATLEL